MKTYISDIIPRLSKYSNQLDNLTMLTEQHWVALDTLAEKKQVYIFRRNNELLISTDGQVERGKWEFIGKNSLLLDISSKTYLLKHGFFDQNVLALKMDSNEAFAIFVNESKFDKELNSIQSVNDFLQERYLNKPSEETPEPPKLPKVESEGDGTSISWYMIKLISSAVVFIFLVYALISIFLKN